MCLHVFFRRATPYTKSVHQILVKTEPQPASKERDSPSQNGPSARKYSGKRCTVDAGAAGLREINLYLKAERSFLVRLRVDEDDAQITEGTSDINSRPSLTETEFGDMRLLPTV